MNLRNLLTWLANQPRRRAKDPFAPIFEDPLADYVDYVPPVTAPEPRVVDHRPRIEAMKQLGSEVLTGALASQVFEIGLPSAVVAGIGASRLIVVITRWPSWAEMSSGQRTMPLQLCERDCESVPAGLAWARSHYREFADKALDRS